MALRFALGLPCVAFVLAFASCSDDGPTEPFDPVRDTPPSAAAQLFISAAGVPQLGRSWQTFSLDSTEAFLVEYGPQEDCTSGCGALAYGLRHGSKIGWMRLDDANTGLFPEVTARFDVEESDSVLSSEAMWTAMETTTFNWFFYAGFVPLMAGDPETSRAALLRTATDMPLSFVTANALLDNPKVQVDREILEAMLARLSIYPPFDVIHERAQGYLDALGPAT